MNHGTLFVGFDIEAGATIAYDNPEFPLVFGRLGVPVGIQLNDELTFYVTPSALLGISDGLLPGTKIPIGLVWAIDDGIAMNFEIDPTWRSPGYPSLSVNVGVRFR